LLLAVLTGLTFRSGLSPRKFVATPNCINPGSS
jgi:hypothetical protein